MLSFKKVTEPLLLLAVPLLLAAGAYWKWEQAALLTFVAVAASLIPFFLRFERRKPRPRDMMPIVVLAAMAAAGRILFAPFPSFKPVSAIVIVAGICFGRESGFLTGALAALSSNLFFGQGPWTPWQMYGWGLVGFLAGLCSEKGYFRKPFAVYLYGFCSAGIYSLILDGWYIVGFLAPVTPQAILTGYGAALPFTLSHGVATVAFLLPIYHTWRKKIARIQQKYGVKGLLSSDFQSEEAVPFHPPDLPLP